MRSVYRIVNDRPVIDRKEEEQISQEPEMQELVDLHEDMTHDEQHRTFLYLNEASKKGGTT